MTPESSIGLFSYKTNRFCSSNVTAIEYYNKNPNCPKVLSRDLLITKLKFLVPLSIYSFYKKYDKRDDFNFDIVNFPFLDGDVPRRPSYGVYISQLIRFVRESSHVTDFNIVTNP